MCLLIFKLYKSHGISHQKTNMPSLYYATLPMYLTVPLLVGWLGTLTSHLTRKCKRQW